MTSDAFKKVWKAEPFRPFALRMASGRRVEVSHPEFVAISPGQRTLAVFEPGTDSADIVDLLLVESIEFVRLNGATKH
ncbi:MAG: hypothetical protein R3B68_13175 [Phycisphaerales bacterium]